MCQYSDVTFLQSKCIGAYRQKFYITRYKDEIKTETAYIFKIYNHAESFEQGLHKLHPAVMILSFPKDISWQTV